MSKILFKQLVDDVTSIIPSHIFKSEEYLQTIVDSCVPTDSSNNIILAHHNSTGGFISGESNWLSRYVYLEELRI